MISDIFPTFGPKSGNTMLTIRGAFLDTGNERSVTIGKKICQIQRSVYSGFSICRVSLLLFTKITVSLYFDRFFRFPFYISSNKRCLMFYCFCLLF